MYTILPALDVKFRVDPAIHSLTKSGMWVFAAFAAFTSFLLLCSAAQKTIRGAYLSSARRRAMIFLREYVCAIVPFTSIILMVLISRFVDRDMFMRFVGVVLVIRLCGDG
jgi:hypothetical protein